MLTIALSHLRARGVRLETHEAVALARELLAQPCGIPTPENIQLGSDGSVSCLSTDGIPSVAGVAGLLLTLLPAGTPNVPAPLRYAIARGLEAVEAPPFGSPGEFSIALKRFEKGASRDVLRGVVERGPRPAPPIPEAPAPLAPRLTRDADPPVQLSWRWAVAAGAALVASSAAGFAVMNELTHRRVATQPPQTTRVSPVVPATGGATNDATPNAAAAKPDGEIDRAARRREIAPSAAAPRPDAPAEPSGPVADAVDEPVGTIRAHRATGANAFISHGTVIFFDTGRERDARSETSGDFGIMTIADDGARNHHVQPSPDGRLVAFDSDRDGARGIYVANRDGSQVRRVSGAGDAALPTWSRNSEWLAYLRVEADSPSVWNLWVQPAGGGAARRVTNYRRGETWAASWFPDDRRVAYSHEDTLMVMDLQTGEATRYRTPVAGRLVRRPAVSPDGTKIMFQVSGDGAWLLDLADGSMQRVLTDPTADEFAWAPDGRRVAFHSGRDDQWGIYVLLR